MRKPCCDKQDTNKGAWSKQEDQKLIDYIRAHGEGCWRSLPKAAGLLRCGKSCRLRWINYLRPDLKRGNFSQDEEDLIIKLHALLGNRWSLIAGRLPGRTDNEVKNYWNSHIKRKLLRMGIDPNNHRLNSSRRIVIQPPPQSDDDYNQCTTSPPTTTATSPFPPTTTATFPSNKNKVDTCESQPQLKISGNDNNDERVKTNSDTASCLEEELSTLPVDVNLDLTIYTFPSPIEKLNLEKKKIEDDTVTVNKEVESSDQDPTLLLFR